MDEQNYQLNFELLFRAVLKQAAKDAFILQTSKKNKKEAFNFLKGGRDLELICDAANVSYEAIVMEMKNLSDTNNKNYKKILNKIKNGG